MAEEPDTAAIFRLDGRLDEAALREALGDVGRPPSTLSPRVLVRWR